MREETWRWAGLRETERRQKRLRHFVFARPHTTHAHKGGAVLNTQVLLSRISYHHSPLCLPKRKGEDRSGTWSEPGTKAINRVRAQNRNCVKGSSLGPVPTGSCKGTRARVRAASESSRGLPPLLPASSEVSAHGHRVDQQTGAPHLLGRKGEQRRAD